MKKTYQNNYAFIDGQNLYLGVKAQGWFLDYNRFRRYLSDKYKISKAFLFIGYLKENKHIYEALQESGFCCVFKPTTHVPGGQLKGNVDAELVLHSMVEYPNYTKALIISGDGDFCCLVQYLNNKGKLLGVLAPSSSYCSSLLKKVFFPKTSISVVSYISGLRKKLGK